MSRQGTKKAAEAVLRELPSVLGACVREDVFGQPREVHLLVKPGPDPRHLAYDVRDLLEERLGVPVDQRVISIAQLAPGRNPGPVFAATAGLKPATQPDAEQIREAGTATEPRVRFLGVSTEVVDGRVRVRVRLELDRMALSADAVGLDTSAGRARAAAVAALAAVNDTCVGRARFEVEHATVLDAFDRQYALASVLVSSPWLGRQPIALVGAQPVELDDESAGALAALKAVNRTLSLVLRMTAGSPRRSDRRAPRRSIPQPGH